MNQYEQGFEDGWRAACEAVKELLDKPKPVDDESDDEEDICRLPIG